MKQVSKDSYLAPFSLAATDVLKEMLDLDITGSETKSEGDLFVSQGFVVVVGFTGGWKGRFFLDMSGETAMQMASLLTGDDYETVAHEEVIMSGAEVGNIISGNAITDINNSQPGLNIRLTPPSVFAGDGISMFNVRLSSSSAFMQTNIGTIKINVAIEEGGK